MARIPVIREGNCVGQDKNVFFKSDGGQTGPEQAIESCNRCHNIEWCAKNLASTAMALSATGQDEAVIAGQSVRWKAFRPEPGTVEGPLPADGRDALDYLRAALEDVDRLPPSVIRRVQDKADAIKSNMHLAYDPEKCTYPRDFINRGVDTLTHAFVCATLESKRVFREDPQLVERTAQCYLTDVAALQALGIRRPFNIAIRHGPDYFEDLFDQYADHPDVSRRSLVRCADYDTKYPDLAIVDYLYRVELFRNFYNGDPYVDDSTIRHYCSTSAHKCHEAIELWKKSYVRLLTLHAQDPDYEQWMLKGAARLPLNKQKQYLYSTLRFSRSVKAFSLNSDDYYGRSRDEITADPRAIDPAEQTVRRVMIENFLSQFSKPQQEAIILVFDLEWLMDGSDNLDAEELLVKLGTDNLESYVDGLISEARSS